MTTIFFGWQPFFWSCHQILGDMIWWPTQDLVAVYTCSTGTGRVLGCRIGSAQWNHDTSYMHLREEKKKCTKFSTYRVYDSCMTAVWHVLTTQDLPRPAPALDLEFWRLVVDLLIALLIGTHRTQQFDQLPRDCSHLCYACMHAWQWQWIAQCQCFLFCWQKNFMCIFWLHTTRSTCANAPHVSSIAQGTNPPWTEFCIDALLRVHSRRSVENVSRHILSEHFWLFLHFITYSPTILTIYLRHPC